MIFTVAVASSVLFTATLILRQQYHQTIIEINYTHTHKQRERYTIYLFIFSPLPPVLHFCQCIYAFIYLFIYSYISFFILHAIVIVWNFVYVNKVAHKYKCEISSATVMKAHRHGMNMHGGKTVDEPIEFA